MQLLRRSKKRWDEQPTSPCHVVLASDGRQEFGKGAVAKAAALAGTEPVAVLTIARIYGTSFGLPNPGLMPTKAELAERHGWVDAALTTLRRKGLAVDGQVASTRKPGRLIARVAQARGATVVVMERPPPTGRVRAVVEGDLSRDVARRLRNTSIRVETVDP